MSKFELLAIRQAALYFEGMRLGANYYGDHWWELGDKLRAIDAKFSVGAALDDDQGETTHDE